MLNLRRRVFYALLVPFSENRRARRMAAFLNKLDVREGARILDLGGSESIWNTIPSPLRVTVLNLPGGALPPAESHHAFTHVVGDACNVQLPDDARFDLVFSNSVIEHVGPAQKQEEFAREVRRLGTSYWVQTPAIWFPIECHSGMPFWFFYPQWLRDFFLNRWRKPLPDWTSWLADCRVLSKSRLRELFPEAKIYVERVLGFPKSYSVWHKVPSPPAK